MNQLFLLAMMMSSLSAPDLDLTKEQLSIDLQQAQMLVLTDPVRCVQSADAFLTRTANDARHSGNSSQDFGYRDALQSNATTAQTIGAHLLLGDCLLQLGKFKAARHALDRGIAMAGKEGELELQAHGLYLKIRSQNLQEHSHSASPTLLAELEALLTDPALKESQLQIYSRLLRTSASIEAHRFDEAKQQLADARHWAKLARDPLASAWVSAVGGDLYHALKQPQLSLGEYIEAQQQAKALQEPLFLGLLSNQIVNLYQEEQEPQKALQYANEAANYFHALDNPSLLSEALVVLARINRDQGEMNLALVYLFNALDLLGESSNRTRIAHLKFEIGKTYLQSGNLGLARNYLNAAYQAHELGDDKTSLLDTQLLLGELHIKQKEAGIAILQLENALTLANRMGDTQRQVEIFRLLSIAYEQNGNPKQALDNYKHFHQRSELLHQQELDLEQEAIRDNYAQVEQAQQVKELTLQLKDSRYHQERYLWSSVITGLLLTLFIYLFFTLWLKLRVARLQGRQLGGALMLEPRTGLANWQRLMNRGPQDMAKQQPKARGHLHASPTSAPDDKLHYLLFRVPFLTNSQQQHGYQVSREIEQAFGAYLGKLEPQDGRIYDLREGHLLYVVPQRQVARLHRLAQELLDSLAAFPCQHPLDRNISLGIVSHPFLPKAATALDHQGLLDLCYLALSGATQLSEQLQQSVWLELAAIDCQQAAFFNGDVWQCGLQAIDKGLVKVNSSQEKQWVNWLQLSRTKAVNDPSQQDTQQER